jgi:hypothetical protein
MLHPARCKAIPRAALKIPPSEALKNSTRKAAETAPPPGDANYSALHRRKQHTHPNMQSTRSKYPNKSTAK